MSGNRSPTVAYKALPTEEREREEKEEAEIRKALATGNGKEGSSLQSGMDVILSASQVIGLSYFICI